MLAFRSVGLSNFKLLKLKFNIEARIKLKHKTAKIIPTINRQAKEGRKTETIIL